MLGRISENKQSVIESPHCKQSLDVWGKFVGPLRERFSEIKLNSKITRPIGVTDILGFRNHEAET